MEPQIPYPVSSYDPPVDQEIPQFRGYPFDIDSDDRADWVLEKLMDYETRIAAIRSKMDAVVRNLQSQIDEVSYEQGQFYDKFRNALELYARKQLEGGKSKTLKLTYGRLSFRTNPARTTVKDKHAALAWARQNAPEIVKTEHRVDNEAVIKAVQQWAVDHEGELPQEADQFLVDVLPSETFHIKSGLEKG